MSLLSCPSCLRRAFNNLSIESTSTGSPAFSKTCSRVTQPCPTTRHHATYESLVTGHHRRAFRLALAKGDTLTPNKRRKGAGSLTKTEIKDAVARDRNRNALLANNNTGLSETPEDRRKMARLKREVEQYYPDPLQLANAVMSKLRTPDFEAAIALVRASEGVVLKNIVSWNHCIDWCMSQGDTNKAWKLFNELKKRGNKPDSHTYTIMLRGLSQNSRKVGSAEKAVGIYNGMSAPNSAVAPNTIHTNAVLNVCARTGDMESMWAIAGRLPDSGPGAPDRWTFTTILNAIREDATAKVAEILKDPRKAVEEYGKESGGREEMEDTMKSIFEEALKDGRKLWADISHRWRRAGLVIDEQLVVAMGRLIQGCGSRKDFPEIFDLVDSMMNIKLAERGHKKGIASAERSQESASNEVSEEMALTEAEQSPLPLSDAQIYATPTKHTLSVILKAALDLKDMKLGKAYWHFLTTPNGPYKIAPDANNIISYLRLLRVSRASTDAVDILSREWPADVAEELYRRGTFVIAMSTCIRDKNNPNVFNTADKLLSLMQEKLEERQLGMYDQIEATENDPSLSYQERRAAAKARMAKVDDTTFGEDEGLSEVQRTKSGVESSLVDPKALRMYIDLAVLKTPGWNEGVAGKPDATDTFERSNTKNTTLRALRRLGPDSINIMRLAKLKIIESEVAQRPSTPSRKFDFSRKGELQISDRAGTRVAERLEDMVDLLRSLVSTLDKVISLDERFEDQDRARLDARLVAACRDQKRRMSGFLSRTKDQVTAVAGRASKYARTPVEDADEDEDERSPAIAREIQRIYEDTDRTLGRTESRSRRQRQERRQGVETRMKKRLGVGEDRGVVDEDLVVRGTEEVERRMRERAFKIKVPMRREVAAG